jgi:periplasmic protein TonB
MRQGARADVYSAGELARAARVGRGEVEALFGAGRVRTVDGAGAFVGYDEAIRVMRAIRLGIPLGLPAAGGGGLRLLRHVHLRRARAVPLAVTGSVHLAVLVALILLAMAGVESRSEQPVFEEVPAGRLVFLSRLGPGGGGGGGGLRERQPAARAERRGTEHLSSPLPVREPPPEPTPTPKDRQVDNLPAVQAPVAMVAADTQDRAGVTEDVNAAADSHGPGMAGGSGAGAGTGLGPGLGAGVGQGEGGGTGGGPFRPGSGISPPRLLHEVKPDYTEEARRQGLEGEVVMEIVVRQSGSVGEVKVLHGMGSGLDQRAIEAVRQWRFSPANRFGQPVDVIVEVSVEFRLR